MLSSCSGSCLISRRLYIPKSDFHLLFSGNSLRFLSVLNDAKNSKHFIKVLRIDLRSCRAQHARSLVSIQAFPVTYIHTDMHACIHTYLRTYVRTYVPTYIHIYIYTYIQRDKQINSALLAYLQQNLWNPIIVILDGKIRKFHCFLFLWSVRCAVKSQECKV